MTLQDADDQIWLLVVDGSSRQELARLPLGQGKSAFAPYLVGSAVWVAVGTELVCRPIHLEDPSLASRLADGFEREGDLALAADYRALAGELDEAASLYRQVGERDRASKIVAQQGDRITAPLVSDTTAPSVPLSIHEPKVEIEPEPVPKQPEMHVELVCEPKELTVGEQGMIACQLTNDQAECLEVFNVIATEVTRRSEEINLPYDVDKTSLGETTFHLFATFDRPGKFRINVLALYRERDGHRGSARGKGDVTVIAPRHRVKIRAGDVGLMHTGVEPGAEVDIEADDIGYLDLRDEQHHKPRHHKEAKSAYKAPHSKAVPVKCSACGIEITDTSQTDCPNCGNQLT